jgi:hypothetical protein
VIAGAVVALDPVEVAHAPLARAVRDVRGHYPRSEFGTLAVDGSILDGGQFEGYAFSKSWRDPDCSYCLQPRFRRLVPRQRQRCPDHPFELPDDDPFPMSAEERAACEARAWGPIAERWKIPGRYEGVSLETSRPTPALVAVRDFLDDEENCVKCLTLAGPTGVGKTQAAIAGFRRAAVWGSGPGGAVFYTMPNLARLLLGEDSDETLRRAKAAEPLLVDDVGGAYMKPGGMVEALFEELMVVREAEFLQTILTTNLTPKQFRELLGDRVADRIEGTWGVWHSLPGASLRRRAVKAVK